MYGGNHFPPGFVNLICKPPFAKASIRRGEPIITHTMVKPKAPGLQSKRSNILLISHALTFTAGLIIHSLIDREDCGDVVMKEIAKNNNRNSLVPNPPPTALRLQPQTQTTLLSAPTAFEVSSKEDRELSFFDIGITTGTDKVLGKINLPLCMKDGTTQCATNAEREECKW